MTKVVNRIWFRKGSGPRPDDLGDEFFIWELQSQSDFGIRAYGEFQGILSSDRRHPSLWALAHAMLVFAGNIAKLLAVPPSAPTRQRKRARRLRKALDLEHLDLDEIREARNFLEHFDERMDRYLGSGRDGILIPRLIEEEDISHLTMDDGRVLAASFCQFLNVGTLGLTLYDKTYQLTTIYGVLEEVHAATVRWLEKRGSGSRST